jgi:hypothetical protein
MIKSKDDKDRAALTKTLAEIKLLRAKLLKLTAQAVRLQTQIGKNEDEDRGAKAMADYRRRNFVCPDPTCQTPASKMPKSKDGYGYYSCRCRLEFSPADHTLTGYIETANGSCRWEYNIKENRTTYWVQDDDGVPRDDFHSPDQCKNLIIFS